MPLHCRTLIVSLLLASGSLFLMPACHPPAQRLSSTLLMHESGRPSFASSAIGEERVSTAVLDVGAGLNLAAAYMDGVTTSADPRAATATPACGKNEEYKECGTACPPTCKNLDPGLCTQQCVSACFCKPGLVRNQSGKCVDPRKCPK